MDKHKYKSHQEKDNYKRYIRDLDYEPTLDERIDFSESNRTDEELSVQSTRNRRRETNSEVFLRYARENWMSWLVGVIIFIIASLMIDSKVDIARIFEKSETMKEDVSIISDKIEKVNETNHNQDLQIQENRIKIENIDIEKSASKMKKDSSK